ncbi:receptor-type tyrosine-protein phosphatase F-like [Montipora foliosa]|uniref:receptor-type tyrosine-protein phosphatase F-like n=1 Tax=Montipora foliosa TaxID=591990 RepID=UPI0035F192BE
MRLQRLSSNMECILFLVVILDFSSLAQGIDASTSETKLPNSHLSSHWPVKPSSFAAVPFTPSRIFNIVNTREVRSSSIPGSSSVANVNETLTSLKSESGSMDNESQGTNLTVNSSRILVQTSVSLKSEITSGFALRKSSALETSSELREKSELFHIHASSRSLQKDSSGDVDTSTVEVKEMSKVILTQTLLMNSEQNMLTTSKVSHSTTSVLWAATSHVESSSLEAKGALSALTPSTRQTRPISEGAVTPSSGRTPDLVTSRGGSSILASEHALSADITPSTITTDRTSTRTILTSDVQKMLTSTVTGSVAGTTTVQFSTSRDDSPSTTPGGALRTGIAQTMQTAGMSKHTVLMSHFYTMSSSKIDITHSLISQFETSLFGLTSLTSEAVSSPIVTSTMQTDLNQSQVQISSSALQSDLLHVGATFTSFSEGTVITNASQSLAAWKPSLTGNVQSKIAETGAASPTIPAYNMSLTVLHGIQRSIIPTNQSVRPPLFPSAQVSVFTSDMKVQPSSLHLASSKSLEDVSMTTNKSQIVTVPVLRPGVIASIITSAPLIISSASVKMPDLNVSVSHTKTHPTNTHVQVAETSWYASSSAVPPSTPPQDELDAPVIQSVAVLSAHSVLLKWNATNIEFIANFSIEVSNDSVTWIPAICNNSLVQGACILRQTEAVVLWLKPYTNYTLRVMARSPFRNSNYSSESPLVLTGEAAPSGSPEITVVYSISSTEIFVAWKPPPPVTLNGKLRAYQVQITEEMTPPTSVPTEGPAIEVIQQGGEPVPLGVGLNLSYQIGQLKKWTSYKVKVRALTVAPGPFSEEVTVHTDEDVPSQPVLVEATTVNSTSIFVNWTEPEEMNGIFLKYEVRYARKDSVEQEVTRIIQRPKSIFLSSLNPYTVYVINVSAFTRKGEGIRNTVEEQTDEGEPSAPQNLSTKGNITATKIRVSWQQPLYPNGIIRYKLSFASDPETSFKLIYFGESTQYLVSNLKPFTKYRFELLAFNLKYNLSSPPIGAMETTDQDRPSPPTHVGAKTVNSTAIKVTWQLPLQPNGEIFFRLYYWQSSEGWGTRKKAYDGPGFESTVAGLHEYVAYTFFVQAYNVKYSWNSIAVNVSETTHPAEPSGPPRSIRAIPKSSTSILVKWVPPPELDRNGIITHYIVKYNVSSGKEANVTTRDNDTEALVTQLGKYTSYSFTVQAVNEIGVGPPSQAIFTRTFEDVPSPPTHVWAKTVNSTAIKVTWQLPLQPNGEIFFRLYYWQTSEGWGTRKRAYDGPGFESTVAGLHEYVAYTFFVQAYNVKYSWNSTAVNVSEITHPAEPSGPPQSIRAVPKSSTSILVKWVPPPELDRNGIITHYIVKYNVSSGKEAHVTTRDNDTEALVTQLGKYTSYSFTVQAVNKIGVGPRSQAIFTRTSEDVPSRPEELQAWNLSESSVYVTWKEPLHLNGELQRYQVTYKQVSSDDRELSEYVIKSKETRLESLTPYTLYTVTVQAFTGAGGGNISVVEVMTDEAAPSSDIILEVSKLGSQSVDLTWNPPRKRNGEIGYFLYYEKTSFGSSMAVRSFRLHGDTTHKEVSGLKPYTEYQFSIVAYNLKKKLNASNPSTTRATTKAAAPSGPPRNVKITSTTSDSITLSWDPPLEPNGKILSYEVMYYEKNNPNKKNINNNVKGRTYKISDLTPYSVYLIFVACNSSGGLGRYSPSVEKRTDHGAPPTFPPLSRPDEKTIKSNSFMVTLIEASNEMGVVDYYQVIVRELATDNTNKPVPLGSPDNFKPKDLFTYEEARRKKPELVPYIAAQFPASEFDQYKHFVVGAGKKASLQAKRRRRRRRDKEYYNGPLQENTYYAVFQRAYVSESVYTSSEWTLPVATAAAVKPTASPTSTHIALIVGLVLVIVLIAFLVLAAIYFVRRKRAQFDNVMDDREDFSNGQPLRLKKIGRKRRSLQKRLMGSTESLNALDDLAASRARRQPVPIDDFERHVNRMHMDGDHGFSEEYSLVQPEEEFSFQQFLNPANKYKNRYANIVAYDHSRVLLNPFEGVPGSDYINASFIDGYNRQRAYIAAQGPLMETFDDFWRMIWEQMSSVIVMLTKLEERGRRKCDQYWPERGTKNYGPIQVKLKETLNMSHYTLRKFVITHKQFPDVTREVKQFHFTAWPDHGVPSHPTPLLSLVRHSFSANRENVGPMVVHCSAGVGRTGTFVTLDVMLQRISQEDSVDVFGFVRQMRYQRNFMVQTEAQYIFIHDALLEAITCGVTEVEAKDLSFRIRELRQFDPETGYTFLENEFCRLAKEENHPIAFKSATLNCNAAKNRYANILPFESTRVHLKMRPGEMGSDYINANFIDGYCQPRAYIATQAPIPDTFEDFWRLIWEQDSAAVVMLTREEEAGKVKCHHYWPNEGSRLYGVILVELIEETSFSDYVSRKFKLTHTEEKDTRTVSQFQYSDWPDTGVPDSGVGIVDLIGQVQKWQQQSGNTIIVIHCSGGVGRTGVFCGISMMIERLKSEGVIDVFQTVQAMRLQRPAMVQTAEQYEFCYTTLQEYLDSFDLYANFQ